MIVVILEDHIFTVHLYFSKADSIISKNMMIFL